MYKHKPHIAKRWHAKIFFEPCDRIDAGIIWDKSRERPGKIHQASSRVLSTSSLHYVVLARIDIQKTINNMNVVLFQTRARHCLEFRIRKKRMRCRQCICGSWHY